MIILRVACDNLYMFKNFAVDFTYERKSNHYLSENDRLFAGSKIKVRKNLIVMGSNASGKTTFGKLLCMIFNFIYGKDLSDGSFNIPSARYDKSKDSSFEIEFVIDDTAYLLKAHFHNDNLHTEKIFRQKIYKSYNIQTLRKKLTEGEVIETYDAVTNLLNIGCKSYAFASLKEFVDLRKKIGFWFSFSELPLNSSTYLGETNIEFLNNVLPKIDNSVISVKRLTVEGENGESAKTNSYQITFKNKEVLTIPDGDLTRCDKRLSHGTFEAIDFLFTFDELSNRKGYFFYIDERLSHMHSELEAYLIYQAFSKKSFDSQIFFTTHNAELLDLNAPITSFLFFRRSGEGFNEVIYPSEVLRKNIRSLRMHYENDYFGVLPDYSVLDKFFEEKSNE